MITEASKQVFNEVSFTHLPLLRHLAEVDVNEDQCQQLLNTLETLTKYATVSIHDQLLKLTSIFKLAFAIWREI